MSLSTAPPDQQAHSIERVSTELDPSKARQISVFLFVLIVGFAMFAAPAIFFQMGHAGRYEGTNLAILGVVQFLLVGAVVWGGLRMLGMKAADIGLTSQHWRRDALLGVAVAAGWATLQFAWIIPSTGGASRPDVAGILAMIDGSWENVLWYLPLGIIGGGIAEEIYNRGFIITVLRGVFGNTAIGTTVAAAFSVLFFAAGHFPEGWISWMDILIPSIAYVVLFLYTKRLMAPMVAHALWNTAAVVGIHLLYG